MTSNPKSMTSRQWHWPLHFVAGKGNLAHLAEAKQCNVFGSFKKGTPLNRWSVRALQIDAGDLPNSLKGFFFFFQDPQARSGFVVELTFYVPTLQCVVKFFNPKALLSSNHSRVWGTLCSTTSEIQFKWLPSKSATRLAFATLAAAVLKPESS